MADITFGEKAIIKVIGVGGGGSNAVNRMIENDVKGVEFIAMNTDAQALRISKAATRIQLGKTLTKGLGAGARPEVGRKAGEESEDDIRAVIQGASMVFITAGMGGGTGTGAAPIVARISKELGCLTVAIVTKPFSFEGPRRMSQAEEGIKELKPFVDTLIIIPNDKLLTETNRNATLIESFREVDNVLRRSIQGIAEVITIPGTINLDFQDIKTVMENRGNALMGIGIAAGPNRAIEATRKAIKSPLLDVSISGAKDAIVFVTSDIDLTLQEVADINSEIRNAANPDINIIFGTGYNVDLEGEVIVTIIATGFDGERSEDDPSNVSTVDIAISDDETTKVKRERGDSSNTPSWLGNRFRR